MKDLFLSKSEKCFPGFSYNRLSREYDWFQSPPDRITPYELVKWAVSCGSWSTVDNTFTGKLFWQGPPGPTPWIGSELMEYPDDDIALQVMRSHYVHWWTQRETVKKAFTALETSKEEKPKDFKLPDETDPDFKGTEKD